MLEPTSEKMASPKFPAVLTRDFKGQNVTVSADHVLLSGRAWAWGFSDESPTCSAPTQSSDEKEA